MVGKVPSVLLGTSNFFIFLASNWERSFTKVKFHYWGYIGNLWWEAWRASCGSVPGPAELGPPRSSSRSRGCSSSSWGAPPTPKRESQQYHVLMVPELTQQMCHVGCQEHDVVLDDFRHVSRRAEHQGGRWADDQRTTSSTRQPVGHSLIEAAVAGVNVNACAHRTRPVLPWCVTRPPRAPCSCLRPGNCRGTARA